MDVSEVEFNPPVVLRSYITSQRNITVIRDDVLIGGTKQRCLKQYLETYVDCKEFVYAGPSNGMAQVALAYIGQLLHKRITLFLQNMGEETLLNAMARSYGARIHLMGQDLKHVQVAAEEYVKGNRGNVICLLPFGLDDELYSDLLVAAFRVCLKNVAEPKRCWLVAGSGTLLRALAQVWTHTKFMTVRVGRAIYIQDYPLELRQRMILFDATHHYKFTQPIQDYIPPYPSIRSYDAKVWRYVTIYGLEGDYIWNVGKE